MVAVVAERRADVRIDDSTGQVYLADTALSCIRDIKDASPDRDISGTADRGGRSGTAVTTKTRLTISGDCADDSSGGHCAHSMIHAVGNIESAACVKGEASGEIEAGLCRRSSVTAISRRDVAGEGGDDSRGVDLADHIVAAV